MMLADKKGVSGLSMRALGRELSVEAMAIYYHFAHKQELVEAMLDVVHGEITVPAEEVNWQDFMRHRSYSVIEVLGRHPWASTLMESGVRPGGHTMIDRERILRAFRHAGFSVEQTVHAVTIIDIFVYGFAAQLAQLTFSNKEGAAAVGQGTIATFPAEEYPFMHEMVSEYMLKQGYDPMGEFRFGLELIIEGIAQRRH